MEDAGLWTASQVPSFRRVVNFIHSQGQKAGIQLQHCGRKASVTAPWLGHRPAKKEENGFPDDLISPSNLPYKNGEIWPIPTAMTKEMIQKSIGDFIDAANLAVEAGFDVIEIHGAHGYLIHQVHLSTSASMSTVAASKIVRDSHWKLYRAFVLLSQTQLCSFIVLVPRTGSPTESPGPLNNPSDCASCYNPLGSI
jgi:hypothetical protein